MKEYILAIDCCSSWTSLGLLEEGRLKGALSVDLGRRQAAELPDMAAFFLGTLGLSVENMSLFAVVTGPGSFTGIKVGIAFTVFAAWGGGKKVIPLSSLECMSFDGVMAGKRIAAVSWAGGGRVYAGAYLPGTEGHTPVSLVPEGAYIPKDLLESLEQIPGGAGSMEWVGDAPEKYLADLAGFFPGRRITRVIPWGGRCALLAGARRGDACFPVDVRARYLRDPDIGAK